MVRNLEIVFKGASGRNGALVHEGPAVGPVRALLEEPVPMLRGQSVTVDELEGTVKAHDTGRLEHSVVGHLIDDVQPEVVTLCSCLVSDVDG